MCCTMESIWPALYLVNRKRDRLDLMLAIFEFGHRMQGYDVMIVFKFDDWYGLYDACIPNLAHHMHRRSNGFLIGGAEIKVN